MEHGKVKGHTRVLGVEQGYKLLYIRDDMIIDETNGEETRCMVSAWFPDDKEREAIARGEPIMLRLLGNGHPPVMLSVGMRYDET